MNSQKKDMRENGTQMSDRAEYGADSTVLDITMNSISAKDVGFKLNESFQSRFTMFKASPNKKATSGGKGFEIATQTPVKFEADRNTQTERATTAEAGS
jgi:hypothetical protein